MVVCQPSKCLIQATAISNCFSVYGSLLGVALAIPTVHRHRSDSSLILILFILFVLVVEVERQRLAVAVAILNDHDELVRIGTG